MNAFVVNLKAVFTMLSSWAFLYVIINIYPVLFSTSSNLKIHMLRFDWIWRSMPVRSNKIRLDILWIFSSQRGGGQNLKGKSRSNTLFKMYFFNNKPHFPPLYPFWENKTVLNQGNMFCMCTIIHLNLRRNAYTLFIGKCLHLSVTFCAILT